MLFITLYLQVKEAIQSNNGDLSAAEADCARIGTDAEVAGEERVKENQQGSEKGKGTSKHPEDDFMATLHQQLQETGQQVIRLQQAMRPQMPAEVSRDLRQGDSRQLDTTEIQEGAQGHQPDPGGCHAG